MAFHVVLFGFVVFFSFSQFNEYFSEKSDMYVCKCVLGTKFFSLFNAELYLELSSVTS